MPAIVLQPKWDKAHALTAGVIIKWLAPPVLAALRTVEVVTEAYLRPVVESRYVEYKLGSNPNICIVSCKAVAVTEANRRLVKEVLVSTSLLVLKMMRPTVGLPARNVVSTLTERGFHSHETPVAP